MPTNLMLHLPVLKWAIGILLRGFTPNFGQALVRVTKNPMQEH